MFRNLLPALSDRYHVVAPDLPGFGFSDAPDRQQFRYTFEHLSEIVGRFTDVIGLNRFALYLFDYGAPVGLRPIGVPVIPGHAESRERRSRKEYSTAPR